MEMKQSGKPTKGEAVAQAVNVGGKCAVAVGIVGTKVVIAICGVVGEEDEAESWANAHKISKAWNRSTEEQEKISSFKDDLDLPATSKWLIEQGAKKTMSIPVLTILVLGERYRHARLKTDVHPIIFTESITLKEEGEWRFHGEVLDRTPTRRECLEQLN